MLNTKTYHAVDAMKFICSILVVCIHTQPFLSYSKTANFILVEIIARIAVPFFFVCAGYFFFKKIMMNNRKMEKNFHNGKSIKKYILHLIGVYIFWTLFYLLWWLPFWYHGGFLTLSNLKGYVLSIFLSGSYFHLWYVVALIYGMLFTVFLLRFFRVKLVILTAVLFYLIGTFAYSYSWIFKGNEQLNFFIDLYKSFGSISVGVFRAFPFLMIGYLFAKCSIKLSNPLCTSLAVLSFLLMGLEVWLLQAFGHSSRTSYVLLTGVTIFFVFNAVVKINLKNNSFYLYMRKMSSTIYFVHPMFINIDRLILTHYFNNKNSAILFIAVLFCSILFSAGVIKLSQLKYFHKLKFVY